MKNRMPYNTKDNFFEDMRENLLAIPDAEGAKSFSLLSWKTAVPAMAACGLMIAVFLHLKTNPGVQEVSTDNAETSVQQVDQIEEYLIDSGISVYQIAEYME